MKVMENLFFYLYGELFFKRQPFQQNPFMKRACNEESMMLIINKGGVPNMEHHLRI